MQKHSLQWLIPLLLLILGMLAAGSATYRMMGMTEAVSTGILPSEPQGLDRYVEHPLLSLMHLVPGILFVLLGPLQFIGAIRRRWPGIHRWSGRLFVASALAAGASALSMLWVFATFKIYSVIAANVLFGAWLIIAVVFGFRAIRRLDILRHRQWMIRAYATGLAVATIRLVFFTVFLLIGDFGDAWLPMMVWGSFLLHTFMAELIIHRIRPRQRVMQLQVQ